MPNISVVNDPIFRRYKIPRKSKSKRYGSRNKKPLDHNSKLAVKNTSLTEDDVRFIKDFEYFLAQVATEFYIYEESEHMPSYILGHVKLSLKLAYKSLGRRYFDRSINDLVKNSIEFLVKYGELSDDMLPEDVSINTLRFGKWADYSKHNIKN